MGTWTSKEKNQNKILSLFVVVLLCYQYCPQVASYTNCPLFRQIHTHTHMRKEGKNSRETFEVYHFFYL